MRRTTNSVHVKYTEIIDLQTVAGKTSVIGIHTPNTVSPIRRLRGFYENYRFVRYNGCRVRMVPAANLPVDPLGLTGVVGTTDTMDPRDALNAICSHGCHGEHLGKILDEIYTEKLSHPGVGGVNASTGGDASDSADKVDIPNAQDDSLSRYYQLLTDVTWKKTGMQSPLDLRLYPLVNKVVSSMPLMSSTSNYYAGILDTMESAESSSPVDLKMSDVTTATGGDVIPMGIGDPYNRAIDPSGVGAKVPLLPFFYTSGVARMGRMPTAVADSNGTPVPTVLPKQFMAVLVLPPAYNVEQFFRMSIVHSYTFSGFTTSMGLQEIGGLSPSSSSNTYFNWIDYDVTTKDTGSKYVEGSTLDLIDQDAKVIADGAR